MALFEYELHKVCVCVCVYLCAQPGEIAVA